MGDPAPRVLLVLPELPPAIGGMQAHAAYFARHLHARGYAVEVAAYQLDRAPRPTPDWPFPVWPVLSRTSWWANVERLEALARARGVGAVYASTVFYGLLAPRLRLPVVCRSVGNDVLRPWLAYPYRLGSGLLAQPWLEDRLVHLFRRLRHPEYVEALLRGARAALVARAARGASRILANSAYTSGLLRALGVPGERLEEVVGGVETARFARPPGGRGPLRAELGLPPDARLVVTACRLEPKKGLDVLLRAFARLRARLPDAHLAIVGDGRQRAASEQLAAGLRLSGHVTFAGRVAHETVHRYYWAADAFVLASREWVHPRTGVHDVETMGRVLCEANAASVPVVAAATGGIPSVIRDGENGLLVPPEDADALAERTRQVLEDGPLAEQLVGGGLAAARCFDWSVVLAAHERALADALAAR